MASNVIDLVPHLQKACERQRDIEQIEDARIEFWHLLEATNDGPDATTMVA